MKTPGSTYAIIIWKHRAYYLTHYGFCLPSACTESISFSVLNDFIKFNNFTNLQSNEGYDIHFIPYKAPTIEIQGIFFLSCFILILVCGFIGTVFNYKLKTSGFWQAFSIKDNFYKLVYFSSSQGDFQFFDGLRTISSVLIVFYHMVVFGFVTPSKNKFEWINKQKETFFNSFLMTAFVVDLFIFMAGVIVVINVMTEIRRKDGKVNWIMLIIRRLIRYYPIYLFIIGFDCLTHGLSPPSSQILPTFSHLKASVQDWAKSIVFMHSVFPKDRLFYLPWTWTTAFDFYYYTVSSFIISVYTKNKTAAYLIIIALLIISTLYTSGLSYEYGLSPLMVEIFMNFNNMFKIYFNCFTRLPPYFIGNFVGFVYLPSKKKNVSEAYEVKDGLGDRFEKFCLRIYKIKNFRRLLYVTGLALFMFLTIGPLLLGAIGEDKVNLSTKAIYLGLQKTLFGLFYALMVLPMALGYHNWFKTALSLKAFGPSAKLSYAIYNLQINIYVLIFMSKIMRENCRGIIL